jgi:hypothetical protein
MVITKVNAVIFGGNLQSSPMEFVRVDIPVTGADRVGYAE